MNCPVCRSVELRMAERSGVEIDYCPECRGVWLDRGELDKIIERSDFRGNRSANTPLPPNPAANEWNARGRHHSDDDDHYDDDRYRYHDSSDPRRRKKGFLGEMFDIFD